MKNLLVASTSTIHGSGYLEYLTETLEALFSETDDILFIPFARPGGISHDAYTQRATEAFKKIGKNITGLHTYKDPVAAIQQAQGIFTGGGNTFVLVSELLKRNAMQPLREVLLNGTPYLGTSAGSNICGITMQNTNDMPIVYPSSFKTTGVVPFNINAHYLDPDLSSTHMGETRETRIKEFHTQQTIPVVGLREGSWIRVRGEEMLLKGAHTARIFLQGKPPFEIASETDLASAL
ncbi:dipeptidase PepE [Cochleicola gelatinilyticus]|uniref:(Alpha)-aspartyl dipeptidase n=1 Tax=Cochleicola gelatinilyticus TaxID=1763537 RepID=A0A167F3J6_9FLAO|nr:dipeptidase PepE [Cochleicola gelatinilyticus]OAB76155.1 (alpha)-aspartyl dipeptidase [Cochleicola gelatinilyticus]